MIREHTVLNCNISMEMIYVDYIQIKNILSLIYTLDKLNPLTSGAAYIQVSIFY